MNRLWWRLLLWLLLLPLLAVLVLPFTERGSGLVLTSLSPLLPVELEYSGGTLAGELRLDRLAWSDATLRVELREVLLELSPGCLWRSVICFEQLQAEELEIDLEYGSAGEAATSPEASSVESVSDSTLVEFPVELVAKNLLIGSLWVHWEGGEWRQGALEGDVRVVGSTVKVHRASVQGARLALSSVAEGSDEPLVLPGIALPLELLVDELGVEQADWDAYGNAGQAQNLRLRGRWLGAKLSLTELKINSAQFGEWGTQGVIQFAGDWPLDITLNAQLPELPGWPELLERVAVVHASGDLASLAAQVNIGGRAELSAKGQVNILEPGLPFELSVVASWPDSLALSQYVALPAILADVALVAPVNLALNGSLASQSFQLQAGGSGLGYDALALHFAGEHTQGRVAIEDLGLRDEAGINTLWANGEVTYGEALQWSLALETSGLDLPPLSQQLTGRVQGQLQLEGGLAGSDWQLSLSGAKLRGSVNGLPAQLTGSAGIDHNLRLLPSDLNAEVNGAKLLLHSSGDPVTPGRLELTVGDIGRWLPDSRGSLSLDASLAGDWQHFSATGHLQAVQWNGLAIDKAILQGNYSPADAQSLMLTLDLSQVEFADIQLSRLRFAAEDRGNVQDLSLRSWGDIAGALEFTGSANDKGEWAGQLATTELQTAHGNWYLGESVDVRFTPSPAELKMAAHCWQYRETRLCPGALALAETGSASLKVDGGLEGLAVLLPDYLKLEGSLQAELYASWVPGAQPVLNGAVTARNLLFTRDYGGGESGSVQWKKADATISNGTGGFTVGAAVYEGDKRLVELQLRLPPEREQSLVGTLDIAGLQLETFAPFAPALSVLEGEVAGSLQLLGTLDRPLAQGALRLSGGQFALRGNPTEMQDIDLALLAQGDRAEIEGQGMLGGGKLDIKGSVLIEPEFRLQLALAGERHELLLPPYTQMLVSEKLAINLTGGLLDLTGDVVIHEGSLEHEQLPEGSVKLSGDVVEVDAQGNVVFEAAAFDTSMDIRLLIEDHFAITGDMVNATLGGDLELRQAPRQPLQVFGNLNIIGGELRAYQQRLRIQRGTVSFSGTPDNPELNVRAQREISNSKVIVGLRLQGTLNQPQLDVFSDPVMSQGETMSYLVRGRGLDSGAGADGLGVALSLGTGLVNQSALVTELNSIPGISNLAFGTEGSTEADTAATVGGYIGERLYLSYGMGIYEPINVLTARLYLQTRLWLEVVSRLENSMDLYYSFDIE